MSPQSAHAATAPVITKVGVTNTNVVKNGLVGHWTFDGKNMTNATATDVSGNGNNGTLVNSPTKVIGKIGQGIYFNGTTSYISVPNNSNLNGSQGTWVFWIKKGGVSSGNAYSILGKSDSSGSFNGININQSANLIGFQVKGATSTYPSWGIGDISDSKWHQVAGSFVSGGAVNLYFDGNLVMSTTTFLFSFSSQPLRIGRSVDSYWEPFKGSLDDVRVYNRVLSVKEIQSLYKAGGGVTIKPSSPNTVTIKPTPSFTCGTTNVTDVDGNTYNTVAIGAQCWMKQNMRVGTRIAVSAVQSNNSTIEKYCYSNIDSNCTSNDPNQPDGGLYQWNEAMQYSTTPGAKGICPTGWHIPTHDELTTMERAICTSGSCATDFPYDTSTTGYRGTNEGTKLKANGTSNMEVNLAGYSISGSFNNRGSNGILWSSSESGGNAWYRYVDSASAQVLRNAGVKSGGFSVRCLKD